MRIGSSALAPSLYLSFKNGSTLTVRLKLSGFADAFEGRPTPMDVYNAQQRKIAADIELVACTG